MLESANEDCQVSGKYLIPAKFSYASLRMQMVYLDNPIRNIETCLGLSQQNEAHLRFIGSIKPICIPVLDQPSYWLLNVIRLAVCSQLFIRQSNHIANSFFNNN